MYRCNRGLAKVDQLEQWLGRLALPQVGGLRSGLARVSVQMWVGVSPVPVQMWASRPSSELDVCCERNQE